MRCAVCGQSQRNACLTTQIYYGYALTVPGEARGYSWRGVVTDVAQLAAVYGRTAVYKIGILYGSMATILYTVVGVVTRVYKPRANS